MKNQLQKAKHAKQDPYKLMLIYWTTLLNNHMLLPLELLNKHVWTDLPMSNSRRSMLHGHTHDNINLWNQHKSDPNVKMMQSAPLPKDTPVMVHDKINKNGFQQQ